MAIPEQTSDASTVPVSLPSTFLIISEKVLHAEVLWVIKVIISHYFNSYQVISCLFSKMFPDSQIAQSFLCGATKWAYLACFGIYPYFHELLIEKISAVNYYTSSFDKSLRFLTDEKNGMILFFCFFTNHGFRYFEIMPIRLSKQNL